MGSFDRLFGMYARKFRIEKLDMTQQDLADEIGVSRETIVRFEAGLHHSTRIADKLFEMGMEYPISNWESVLAMGMAQESEEQ